MLNYLNRLNFWIVNMNTPSQTSAIAVKDIINRLLALNNMRWQKELADKHQITNSTLSMQIKRGQVPFEIVLSEALEHIVSLDMLIFGEQTSHFSQHHQSEIQNGIINGLLAAMRYGLLPSMLEEEKLNGIAQLLVDQISQALDLAAAKSA
jgi:hypothetical protein